MFDQLSAEIPASLIKGFPRTTRTTTSTTKQNVDPAVHFVYSRVKIAELPQLSSTRQILRYAPRFHGKKSKKNSKKINFKKNFKKNNQKNNQFFFQKIKKLLCLNSFACNRGSA
jgi:hypothetical protein